MDDVTYMYELVGGADELRALAESMGFELPERRRTEFRRYGDRRAALRFRRGAETHELFLSCPEGDAYLTYSVRRPDAEGTAYFEQYFYNVSEERLLAAGVLGGTPCDA